VVKRAEALQPLSREHLSALLVAKKMREADELGYASRVFLDFWHDDGQRHFRVEEEVLLPAWAAEAEVARDGVVRMLEEHLEIRRQALRLAADELTLEEARALGAFLHDHVRFEERKLFPLVEEALGASALSRLAAAVEQAEAAS
jgi:hemerythrin-like domain-containing protein